MRPTILGCGVLLLLLAAGCTSEIAGTPMAGGGPTAPTTSAQPPATATSPPSDTTSEPATIAVCTVRDVDMSLGAEEGTAGTVYRALVFTNTGGRTRVIQGFPGMSFVTGDDGHQIGEAAEQVGPKGPPVTLKPGGTATAPVGFVNIGNFDEATCRPTAVRGLRAYPPHERRAEFVPFETTACAGDLPGSHLTVRTVHEGSGLAGVDELGEGQPLR
ncbi:MAG: DUF4232 domain-containing protein [Actinophytocola sp.]|uniref:DUF4232 domain-containing protein n=1 Tax=Actinophytocola sp. TaxID=1872138 RepID=UPI001323C8A3|nr:DUF4232 domain-containing protein [Actinophytocola sp.]MPZ79035.1 DUF4232 domain-containing protein [Actinophytocola sp.]